MNNQILKNYGSYSNGYGKSCISSSYTINYSKPVSSKCHVLVRTVIIFLVCNFISSYTTLFPSLVLVFNQRSCLGYFPVNFRVLTPKRSFSLSKRLRSALTSHVNNMRICFLKKLGSMNAKQMLIYTPMSLMCRRYSVRSLQKSNTLPCMREVSLE